MNPKEIQDRLDNIELDTTKKANKFEINDINDKLLFYDENQKDLNFKMDTLQQIDKKIRGDNQKIIKKIEYLSGELNLLVNDNSSEDKGKVLIIDQLN